MKIKRISIPLCLIAALSAFAHEHGSKTGVAGVKSLDVYLTNGKEHLLVGEAGTDEDATRLLYLSSTDDGHTWSEPVQANNGMPAPHGLARGADAQIAAAGDRLVAVWQTAGGDTYGGGPMATALSSDGGKTWRAGPKPADDKLNIGHGYIDITADETGAFHLVWLDSRNGKQGLYYARSDDGGEHWSKNATIDPETCECCWNSITAHNGKLFVLYRELDPRDMTLAVSDDRGSTWRKASTVGTFGWHFNGCPEVGGDLAFTPNELHAVTWTGKPDAAGVYAWNSANDGGTWDSQKLGDPTARDPAIASRGNDLAAAWDEPGKGLFVATSSDAGKTWTTQHLGAANDRSTHPRLLSGAKDFRVFWTEPAGDQSVWRSAEVAATQSVKPAGANIRVEGGWIRAMPPSSTTTAAFMKIINDSDHAVHLIGGKAKIAGMVAPMITTTSGMPGHEMKGMQEVDELEILPHGERLLQPGGDHLMLMQLQAHPQPGETAELTLRFNPGGEELNLQLPVRINQ